MQTFEEFKELIDKVNSQGSQLSIDPSEINGMYNEQCLNQIGVYFNMTLGFFLQNYKELDPKQMYDWVIAIEKFFRINTDKQGRVESFGEERKEIELTKQQKIDKASDSLVKSGIIL